MFRLFSGNNIAALVELFIIASIVIKQTMSPNAPVAIIDKF